MAMEGTTTSGAFTGTILAEKLLKLNITQQSIETLSHWCIFHRKKAREIVETWAKKFHDAPIEQRVPFLYLANDILQNSRRKGSEFVDEFWTVLPRVLRDNVGSGDESVKNAAYRLVDIWEERRVFGSRAQGLREELLGIKRPQPPVHEARHFIVPPSQSPTTDDLVLGMDFKMIEGSLLERVARSYHTVQATAVEEQDAMSKYYAAVSQIESLKEAEGGAGNGNVQVSIINELLEQQAVVKHCIEQLEGFEKVHALLCSHLKDFLLEQENNREQIRTRLQIAQAQLEEVGSIHRRLSSRIASPGTVVEQASFKDFNKDATANHHKGNGQVASPSPRKHAAKKIPTSSAENSHQPTSVAAEVAAKLTASNSSTAMLTSVLSSLAAEEASNGGVQSPNGGRPLEKRLRVDDRPEEVSPPLPPPPPPYLPYAYQSTLPPPPPPLQAGPHLVQRNQHAMGLPPQLLPPGFAPTYQPFQPSSMPYYSQPPLPAPPAPAPRQ
ncbi:hypothetical protein KC19_6G143400 [Ceratodon purpureus]|uniref:CID domain-containing protein n=1 Tax=Ceratodon purpureus TaxID=3225 RepID=A0A8T0HGM1_CERPU|nr:hypothetical protein KC19_6G143400 [Ceratodon purpureus]